MRDCMGLRYNTIRDTFDLERGLAQKMRCEPSDAPCRVDLVVELWKALRSLEQKGVASREPLSAAWHGLPDEAGMLSLPPPTTAPTALPGRALRPFPSMMPARQPAMPWLLDDGP